MSELTLAQRLATFAVDASYDRLPDEVIDSVRKRVLDVLGICVAATPLETSGAARSWAIGQGSRPLAHGVGVPEPVSPALAGFVNGVLAHSLDYDDTHLPSVLHPSASVIPAAVAVAESTGKGGHDLISAISAGLETCVRIGMAGYDQQQRNSTFFEHGQHATSICGALGASVAAGLLLGLDAGGIVDALGIAASMASGVIEANRTGGTVKRMHCGWAAHAGISAAELAKCGFTGPPTVLEGRFGFFQAWLHGNYDASAITEGLGHRWEVPGIFFKPYPANHFTHTAIDAARQLRNRGLSPNDVASATLGVAAAVVRTIGEPIEIKRAPQTGYMAQFSGPYAIAVGLFGGRGLGAGLDDYTDELAHDPERLALMERVQVVADERCNALFPHQFPAILRVTTRNGDNLVEEVLINRGGPERPLSYQELAAKFRDNASRLLPAAEVDSIQQKIASLEKVNDVRDLMAPLAKIVP